MIPLASSLLYYHHQHLLGKTSVFVKTATTIYCCYPLAVVLSGGPSVIDLIQNISFLNWVSNPTPACGFQACYRRERGAVANWTCGTHSRQTHHQYDTCGIGIFTTQIHPATYVLLLNKIIIKFYCITLLVLTQYVITSAKFLCTTHVLDTLMLSVKVEK